MAGAERRKTRNLPGADFRYLERGRTRSAYVPRAARVVARRYARSLAGRIEIDSGRVEVDGAVQLETAGGTIHQRLLSFSDHAFIGDFGDAPSDGSADRARVQ